MGIFMRALNSSVGRTYGAKQKSGAKDIVRRFGMERLKSAVYAVEYEGLRLPRVNSVSTKKQSRSLHDC